ncbi:MAG: replication/maintenance protein RepL [Campylobacter sp.]
MDDFQREIFGSILGEKKVEIIEFLCKNADKDGFIWVKISTICENINVSKPTVIDTFAILESKKIFKRIKNGLYKFELKFYTKSGQKPASKTICD